MIWSSNRPMLDGWVQSEDSMDAFVDAELTV